MTILFDLDGTLTDPKIGITKSVQYALKSFGIDEPTLDVLTKFIGPPLRDSFANFYGFFANDTKLAVANALDEVKAAADYVCGDCDEDGVARWIFENVQ
jgi:hydroxymethylpyrimidine pyrophosphatase-like HAD family hydrolase